MLPKTYMLKKSENKQVAYLIDAKDQILGKVATKAAVLLRGKNKVTFTPHTDSGDQVIIINASKVKVTGKKLTDKIYQRYSGYPSGQKEVKLQDMLKKAPTEVIRLAVNRMIPSGPLGNAQRSKLKVYKGEDHPHQAQKPKLVEVT